MTNKSMETVRTLLGKIQPDKKRSDFTNDCFAIDSEVLLKLRELGYYTRDNQLTPEALEHFKDSSGLPTAQERLDEAKAKRDSQDTWTALDCWVQNAQRTVHFFLEKYNIGYVDTVFVDEAGMLQVAIECMTGNDHDGKWDTQLETLREMGITLQERQYSGRCCVPATSENIAAIRKIFKANNEGVHLHFSVEDDTIETLTVEMEPPILKMFEAEAMVPEYEPIVDEKGLFITETEYNAIADSLESMLFAYANVDTAINNLLVAKLLETHCALISNILDVNTVTRQIIDERFKNEKAIAAEYHQLDKELGDSVDANTMSAMVVRLLRDVHAYVAEKTGLYVRDFKIYPSSYGYVGATLKFPRAPRIDKQKWDVQKGMPVASDANRKKILSFCNEHNMKVLGMDLAFSSTLQDFIIEQVRVQIMDLTAVLKN